MPGRCRCPKTFTDEGAHLDPTWANESKRSHPGFESVSAGVGRLQVGVKRVRLPYKKPLERPYFTASLVSENGAFSSAGTANKQI